MPKLRQEDTRGDQIIAIRFRVKEAADDVVARLLQAARRTDLSLVKVLGDGDLVYPFGGGNPARGASSWRAEFCWGSPALRQGWHLEAFMMRAELYLDLPGGVWMELG